MQWTDVVDAVVHGAVVAVFYGTARTVLDRAHARRLATVHRRAAADLCTEVDACLARARKRAEQRHACTAVRTAPEGGGGPAINSAGGAA